MAGAQVASRRKAHHGSSRTVFHEGSGQARGTLTHRPAVERDCGQCYYEHGCDRACGYSCEAMHFISPFSILFEDHELPRRETLGRFVQFASS